MTSITHDRDAAAMIHRGILVLAVSTLAGLLLAGALFPLVGGAGLIARQGARSFVELPPEIEEPPLPVRSRILAADGSLIATVYLNENRITASLSRIPVHMQHAILAIEDQRFYQHNGVDYRGLARAVWKNRQAGEITQGGSTITQQYVKNVLLEKAATTEERKAAVEQSPGRKLREARYALALERKYSKREILEKYLNIAYFGQGVYGVATASQHYFSKPVERLTVEESALLAGMVRSPTVYDPQKNAARAKARRDLVLATMADQTFITQDQKLKAQATPIALRVTSYANDCGLTFAPYFCAYVRDEILNDGRFTGGSSRDERKAALFQGGLTIQTTLDAGIQRTAQQVVDTGIDKRLANRAAVVATVVRPGTGEVLAIASNQTFGEGSGQTQINHALGGAEGYQPGSTFKPFVLAAAVKQGIPLALKLGAPGTYYSRKYLNNGQPYKVSNFGGSGYGVIDMQKASWNSVNTYYIQLAERTGLREPIELAKKMGLTRFEMPRGGATMLGSAEVSPLQLTEAYATFAARGMHCPAIGVTSILDRTERPLFTYLPRESCKRVFEVEHADTVNSVLQGVVTKGTGKAAAIGRPVAGKTGTSQDSATAWFQGYTPQLSAGIFMGHPQNAVKHPLIGLGRPGGVTGGSYPAQMWKRLMSAAHRSLPVRPFPPAPANAYLGEKVALPDVTGMEPQDAVNVLTEAGFNAVISPTAVPAYPVPLGRVGTTRPRPGTMITPGTTVNIYISNGKRPPPPPSPTASPSPSPSPSPGQCKPKDCPSPTPSPQPSASASPSPSPSPSKRPR